MGPKIIIDGGYTIGGGPDSVGMHINNPALSLSVRGHTFANNKKDVEGLRAKNLDFHENNFGKKMTLEQVKAVLNDATGSDAEPNKVELGDSSIPAQGRGRALKGYVGGCSFSKGEHIK